MRRVVARRVARRLGTRLEAWRAEGKKIFESLALVLDLIGDLPGWSRREKSALLAILRAKAGRNEVRYVRLMQRHARLREALLLLGQG